VGLIAGWILCPGRHTVSRSIQSAGALLQRRHFSAVCRFLAEGRWSMDSLSQVLLRLLLPWLPAEITVLVDDTLCHRGGPHLFGGGMFHDAVRSTYGRGSPRGRHAQFAFGHNWVVLAVWVPLPWQPERGKAVPLLFRLYQQKARCHSGYRKRTELALEMILQVASWLPADRGLLVVGDAEYASRTVVRQLPDPVTFVGPMSRDAALYQPAPGYRGKGRPRKRGRRLPSPAKMARRGRWRSLTVKLYGRDVRIHFQSRRCLWYTVAGTRIVRMIVTRDPKGRIEDRAYFCTDPDRSVADILSLYARRWELEVTFREAKQSLGFEDPQNGWWRRQAGSPRRRKRPGPQPRGRRGSLAVLRTAPFALLAHALVMTWYLAHGNSRRDTAQARKRAPWYRHKAHPSFADMLAALQQEIWLARLSSNPCRKGRRRISVPVSLATRLAA
jgi:hypothetical protein